MKMLYMAAPYTSESVEVRNQRRNLCDIFAARLTGEGAVFSPITHGTRLEPHLPSFKVKDHDFWMKQCYPLLRKADELVLLPLEGWRESKGVQLELEFALRAGIPIGLAWENKPRHLSQPTLEEMRRWHMMNTYLVEVS